MNNIKDHKMFPHTSLNVHQIKNFEMKLVEVNVFLLCIFFCSMNYTSENLTLQIIESRTSRGNLATDL
jgi:hypothetical protein